MAEQNIVTPKDGGTGGLMGAAGQIEDLIGPDEESEEVQEAEAEESPDEVSEAETDEDGETETEEVEEGPLTLDAVAKALDRDDLDDVQLTVRADGKDETLTLSELKRGYQRASNYTRQTQELAQQRKSLESDFQGRAQAVDGIMQVYGAGIQTVKNLVLGQMNSPEMQQLRTENPQEWSARQLDAQRLAQNLDQVFQQAAGQYGQWTKAQQEQAQKERQERLRAEANRLADMVPDWSSETDAQISNYLVSEFGFDPEEIQGVDDARHIAIAWKAYQYDRMKATEKQTKKKVVSLPKGPGPAKPKGPSQRKQRKAADIQHRKQKNVDSAAAALKARGIG